MAIYCHAMPTTMAQESPLLPGYTTRTGAGLQMGCYVLHFRNDTAADVFGSADSQCRLVTERCVISL